MTAPLPQHILMNIQISRRLNDGNAAEWQLEGIASAKARGVYKGRRPSIDPAGVWPHWSITHDTGPILSAALPSCKRREI